MGCQHLPTASDQIEGVPVIAKDRGSLGKSWKTRLPEIPRGDATQMMIARSPRWLSRSVLVLSLSFLSSGCGGGDELPREAVSGTVDLDGKPLEKGTIRFTPAAQSNAVSAVEGGAMIESGKFSIPRDRGLVPGNYQVAVFGGGPGASGKSQKGTATGGPSPTKESIPAKYNAQSKLQAEVKKGGPNDFTFNLTSQ